jgi:choline dehydrogenase-like flavoprotein
MAQRRTRTLIVGAGSAGVPLAARLGEDPSREVTLLEAGPAQATPEDLLEGSTIRGAMPGYRDNWVFDAELAPGHPATIARGRALGGSTTINGGYFVRATRADFDRWATAGGPEWRYEQALPILRTLENDLDFGAGQLHGTGGPMPVTRPPQTNSAAAAFVAAALELGFPIEVDKNAQGSPGAGAVPSNIVGGRRVNTGLAYADALKSLGSLGRRVVVRGNARVLRVLTHGQRAVGVELEGGSVIEADEVILSAGAILSPHLLLHSGIGPRDQLRAFGIPLVADLPVGAAFNDHPNLAFSWRAQPGIIDRTAPFGFPTALNFDAAHLDPTLASRPEGDIEILLTAKPLEFLLTGSDDGSDTLQFLVALQEHSERGQLTLGSGNPLDAPRISYRYLAGSDDRRRMRVGVRAAGALLRSRAFVDVFKGHGDDGFVDIDDATLGDDERLDAWIMAHLGTALHTCGTAPMGSVVDGAGRVIGVEGLRVADTSILPTAPHRGPANTAVFIGEFIARRMLAGA